jgi:ribonuclease HI
LPSLVQSVVTKLGMPWITGTLRNATVFVKCESAGVLAVQAGRVEIRYRQDDPRAYHAGIANLTVDWSNPLLPDDSCVTAAKSDVATSTKKSSAAVKSGTQIAAPPAGAYIAYTDGACSGNPGPAGLGVVLVDPSGNAREAYEYLGVSTNNVAELTAIYRALQGLDDKSAQAVIHTDSQYAIGVLSKGWKAKANQQLILEIRLLLKTLPNVSFVYVRGHVGIPLNERADALAREAVSSRGSRALGSA